MRVLLLDFDHTLFDTDRFFWVDVREVVRGLGVDLRAWDACYEAVWPTGYALDKHVACLAEQYPPYASLRQTVGRILREQFADLRGYLFEDVEPFLSEAAASGMPLALLSFGDPGWQGYKVQASGVASFFLEVFYTGKEGGKGAIAGRLRDRHGAIRMIDNDPRELDAVKGRWPEAETFWIRRPPLEASVEPAYRWREALRYAKMAPELSHRVIASLKEIAL